MAFDRARAEVEAFGDVIVFQAGGVEPFFERFGPAAVAEGVAIPDAAQEWHFVEAGASAGLHGEGGRCR